MADPIVKTVEIPAAPDKVYEALLEARIFGEATGAPAEIDATSGGAFSCFGGVISGRNIELQPGRTIVQAWRVKFWPEGDYSLVRFDLEDVGGRTKLRLEHKGFPPEFRDHLNGDTPQGGWDQQYLEPLRRHFS